MSTLETDRLESRAAGGGLRSVLDRAFACVERAGMEGRADALRLCELGRRLGEERLQIAVLGQFKRGKSTFLNALLAEDLLPTAVVPLTAVPVYLEHGARPLLRVGFLNGHAAEEYDPARGHDLRAELLRLATEAGNSANRLGVRRIELFHPAPILGAGIVLIDTPGVGSTLRHNTQATLDFLSECDAALFVVSPDPPITEVEVDFLARIQGHAARLIFVLNKIDYLDEEERAAATGFLRRVLERQVGLGPEVPLFCLSARQALRGAQAGDARLVERSGLAAVKEHLLGTVAREKTALLRRALAHKAGQALDALLMQLGLEIRSLTLPLDSLEERLALFDRAVGDIERQRVEARDLLAGDQKRAVAELEADAEDVRTRARQRLRDELERAFAKDGAGEPEATARAATAAAVGAFFPDELARTSSYWERRLGEMLAPHRRRARELTEAVRRAAAEIFDVPCAGSGPVDGFEAARQPYWVTGEVSVSTSDVGHALTDPLLPPPLRRLRQKRRLVEQVEMLVRRNVENLRWATLQNINETFRRFGAQLDRELAEAIEATQGAIHAAHAKRRDSADSVGAEVARLNGVAAELRDLRTEIAALTAEEVAVSERAA
jgi:GTP-binding protein EngB required for normal cell division